MAVNSLIGTDINQDWNISNGDFVLVSDEENLIQSIRNRLNCTLDYLDYFYLEYGSVLKSFLGFKAEDKALEFIRIEIINSLNQDPRLEDFDVDCSYNGNGEISVGIIVYFDDDSDLSMSLVITEEGSVDIGSQ